jgi:DNA modification methylase
MKQLQSFLQLTVVYLLLSALRTNPHNARKHSKYQIRQIAASIREFGFLNAILIDVNNVIIAGHGRAEAAKLLGMEMVPTIRLESLTEDQLRIYMLADNKIAEQAGWDQEILSIEMQHLVTIADTFDPTISGFEIAEIDSILQEARAEQEEEEVVSFDETAQAVTRQGDLWQLGKHRVFCGNSLDEASYKILMGNRRAHLVCTDPPFNVRINGNVSGKGAIHHREFVMASGEMSEAEFVAFLTTSLRLLARYSIAGSVHFIFIDWRHLGELLAAGKPIYNKVLNLCVWAKDCAGMGSLYRSQHELIFVFQSGKGQHRNNIQLGKFGRNRTNIWRYPSANTQSKQGDEGNLLALHPTVKPVQLVADAILDCSARGDIILDSFLGSGSTMIAAERVGRVCHGIELDARYVDVAIRRWQRLTGDHAIHATTHKYFDDLAAAGEVQHG